MGDSLLLWGKSGAGTVPHPLLHHMLDTGMVARALLGAPQWQRIRRLSMLRQLSGPELLRMKVKLWTAPVPRGILASGAGD